MKMNWIDEKVLCGGFSAGWIEPVLYFFFEMHAHTIAIYWRAKRYLQKKKEITFSREAMQKQRFAKKKSKETNHALFRGWLKSIYRTW